VIWPHTPEKLAGFLDHPNSLHKNIQFTMEKENGHLPFLDTDIYRRPDDSLGHKVYQKTTHTNLYLNQGSHHHPSSKHAIFTTLVHTAMALCNKDSLQDKLEFLKTTFKENGYYSLKHIREASTLPREPPGSSTNLPQSLSCHTS
jgi:hypothetical protein